MGLEVDPALNSVLGSTIAEQVEGIESSKVLNKTTELFTANCCV